MLKGHMPKPKTTKPPAPPPPSETVPDIRELGLTQTATANLAELILQHGELGIQKRDLEKQRKALTPQIKTILGQYQIGKLTCGDFRVSYHNSPRNHLSTELLLEHGVSPEVIKACTVVKDCYTLKVAPQKGWRDDFGGGEDE